MRGSTKVLLLGVLLSAVAGACGRAEGVTAADAWQASDADAVPAPDAGQTVQDETPPPPPSSDSTARWGGGLGSGT